MVAEVTYYGLGSRKRLNEIVMAGSHDAGITEGGGNAKTQKLDIRGQADAGVRIFDLRIAGAGNVLGGEVKLKTYHGPNKGVTVNKPVSGLQGGPTKVVQSKVMGTWGQGLVKILDDAKGFVDDNKSEFLILKFDKCQNWDHIAELCVQKLTPDDVLYTGGGNVNKKTLRELRRKVIVVFTQKGLDAIDKKYHGTGGILGIKSLKGGDSYEDGYDGIQYVGKGGTDITTAGKGRSIQENIDKQTERLAPGLAGNPNVMGMMYWTTTGGVGNIRDRNKKMWEPKHVNEMQQLWTDCMGDAVKERIPRSVNPSSHSSATVLKRFLPNFVMIDFASPRKCKTIYDLNYLIPIELSTWEAKRMKKALSKLS